MHTHTQSFHPPWAAFELQRLATLKLQVLEHSRNNGTRSVLFSGGKRTCHLNFQLSELERRNYKHCELREFI